MVRFALFFVLPFSIASASLAAELFGIPAWDDFLTKYEACLADKVPAARLAHRFQCRLSLRILREYEPACAKLLDRALERALLYVRNEGAKRTG